jgi:hypothetical protein
MRVTNSKKISFVVSKKKKRGGRKEERGEESENKEGERRGESKRKIPGTFVFDFALASKNPQLHLLASSCPSAAVTARSSSKSLLFPTKMIGT